MMFSTSPITVNTPPIIAHVDVMKRYVGMCTCWLTIEIGDRSYLRSTDGMCISEASNLLLCTCN